MASLDTKSYENHKNAEAGDTVIATDDDGTEYRGTVVKTPGATVYVQSNTGEMLEFRRLKDNGNPVIVLGIDGKNEVTDHEPEHGVNPDGIPITKESSTLSFDHQIVDFEAEAEQHTIG